MYLNAAAPGILKADIAVEEALQKSFTNVQESDNADSERLLKNKLSDAGIYYFGPLRSLDKHQRTGPNEATQNLPHSPALKPLPHQPHGDRQEPHGNRPGKRTLIGLLAAWKKHIDPSVNVPKRAQMLMMSTSELHALAAKIIPEHIISGVGQKIRTVDTSDKGHGIRRRAIDGSDAFHLRGRGQGKNMREGEYMQNLLDMLGERPMAGQSKTVRVLTERPRRPGRDVVNYESGVPQEEQPKGSRNPLPEGFKPKRTKNEREITSRARLSGTGGGREALGSEVRDRSPNRRKGIKDHPEYEPGKPEPALETKNPFRPRAGVKSKAAMAALKEKAKLIDRNTFTDDRIGGRPNDRETGPLPETVRTIEQVKGTVMADLFAKLSPEMQARIKSLLAQGISPAKLNSYIRAAAISEGIIEKAADPNEVFKSRLEKMRSKKKSE
jgi:hypothetical protein